MGRALFASPAAAGVRASPQWRRVRAFVFALSLTAFVAPPFSGLDTLPALGVVVLALAILLEDIVLAGVGLVIGAVGAALVLFLGGVVLRLVGNLF